MLLPLSSSHLALQQRLKSLGYSFGYDSLDNGFLLYALVTAVRRTEALATRSEEPRRCGVAIGLDCNTELCTSQRARLRALR